MVKAPRSSTEKQQLLEEEAALIERAIDAEIDKVNGSGRIQSVITAYLDQNSRSVHPWVKQTIIDKYTAAGWRNVQFHSENDRNETLYWVQLEQD